MPGISIESGLRRAGPDIAWQVVRDAAGGGGARAPAGLWSGLNGIGATLIQAIFNRDYPMVQASALFLAAVFVVVNTSVDLLYGFLDPRIKYA